MKSYKCRMCGEPAGIERILEIKNVPTIVQNLSFNKDVAQKQKESLFIYQCVCCDLIQLANKPVFYYKNVIRSAAFSNDMKTMRLKQINQFRKKHQLNKEINAIEVGSGNGEYLQIIKKIFPNTAGLENGLKGLKKKGVDSEIKGFIDSVDYKITNHKYQAFFIFNFLEHIPEPRKFLTGLRNNLAKNSVGIIEVPNFDHMISRGIDYDYTREHLIYFTENTLSKMLALCGFECLSIKKIWQGHILSAEIRTIDGFRLRRGFADRSSVEFIDKMLSSGKKIAIWGACHHSFFLTSQLKNYKKVSYFVDSADFKIGKYSPGTGIKILKPDVLNKNPPDILLIIASSYSLEVAKLARKNYKDIANIFMLSDNNFVKV